MESASRWIQAKFEGARTIFEAMCGGGGGPPARAGEPTAGPAGPAGGAAGLAAGLTAGLMADLAALEARYSLAMGHLYLMPAVGELGRRAFGAEFLRTLAAEGFADSVDQLVARAESSLQATGALRGPPAGPGEAPGGRPAARGGPPGRGPPGGRGAAHPPRRANAMLQRLFDIYPWGATLGAGALALPVIDYHRCPTCGGDMAVDSVKSELHCRDEGCGSIRELVGTVFDDSQFYNQEGQKAKSGSFNPNRHFQFWWAHILAREPEEEIGEKNDPENRYGERLLLELRAIIFRDRKVLRLLTVNDVRAMLREVGRSDLNKNVPLIMKKLTGVGPPTISDAVAVRVENLFTKAIEVGERVRRSDRVNRNYYPYYIGRILEQLLPEEDLEARRVLYYIYLQSQETVEADDADWEMICLELGEIAYSPTDRALGGRYGPALL